MYIKDLNVLKNFFQNNEKNPEIEYLFSDADEKNFFEYIKYNNKAYKITLNKNFEYNNEDIELIYKPNGKEGSKVLYDCDNNGPKSWVIIYDDGNDIEIISEEVFGSLKLGLRNYQDKENKIIVKNNIDIYNNLIEIINNYCKEIVNAETDKSKIRSVGASQDKTNKYYNSSALKEEFNNILKEGDRFYEQDMVRMTFGNIGLNAENKLYYMASRYCGLATRMVGFEMKSALASFNARIVNSDGNNEYYGFVGDDTMLLEIWDDEIFTFDQCAGVRPIIKNPIKYELA